MDPSHAVPEPSSQRQMLWSMWSSAPTWLQPASLGNSLLLSPVFWKLQGWGAKGMCRAKHLSFVFLNHLTSLLPSQACWEVAMASIYLHFTESQLQQVTCPKPLTPSQWSLLCPLLNPQEPSHALSTRIALWGLPASTGLPVSTPLPARRPYPPATPACALRPLIGQLCPPPRPKPLFGL